MNRLTRLTSILTQLTIINETFDGNKERLAHIRQGWEMVMAEMKRIMEAEEK